MTHFYAKKKQSIMWVFAFSLIMVRLAEKFDKMETGLSFTEPTKLKIINK